jgi:hypothetical protein
MNRPIPGYVRLHYSWHAVHASRGTVKAGAVPRAAVLGRLRPAHPKKGNDLHHRLWRCVMRRVAGEGRAPYRSTDGGIATLDGDQGVWIICHPPDEPLSRDFNLNAYVGRECLAHAPCPRTSGLVAALRPRLGA